MVMAKVGDIYHFCSKIGSSMPWASEEQIAVINVAGLFWNIEMTNLSHTGSMGQILDHDRSKLQLKMSLRMPLSEAFVLWEMVVNGEENWWMFSGGCSTQLRFKMTLNKGLLPRNFFRALALPCSFTTGERALRFRLAFFKPSLPHRLPAWFFWRSSQICTLGSFMRVLKKLKFWFLVDFVVRAMDSLAGCYAAPLWQ